MKVKETKFINTPTIFKLIDHHVGIALMISGVDVPTNEQGKKVISAGTLVGNTVDGVVTIVNNGLTEGVLLHDTDVTHGDSPATMIIHGFIDKTKIPVQPSAEALQALPMIKFL